ncbi:hypothetical protein CRE_19066 [Caenorhabditis remanei]|uniref:Serpentine Receptor, class H n=1 Tax=Caenorhabditis remanei TaxID=31234 RepID=E3LLK3_CAERE|nr:hypothetical protein CRE_19066 [Caenorhabditis remanei]
MEISFISTPEFITFSLHIITALETPLHIFGTYCILFKSPDSMKSVKWSMLNLHFWSVCLDWTVTFFIIPFVLFPTVAGFSLGMFNYMNVPLQHQCYLFAALLCTVNVATMTVLENRYYILFGKETSWRKIRVPVLAMNYILAFIYPLPAFLNFPDQLVALPQILQKLPQLPDFILRHQIIVYATELQFFVIPIILMSFLLATEILILAKRMYTKMNSVTYKITMSQKTLSMQRAILIAFLIQVSSICSHLTTLLFQTSTMAVNFLIPITYICYTVAFNYHNQVANNICFVIFSLHGLSSTSIMLWSHKPYRAVCYKFLRFKKSETTSSRAVPVVNMHLNTMNFHSRHS